MAEADEAPINDAPLKEAPPINMIAPANAQRKRMAT